MRVHRDAAAVVGYADEAFGIQRHFDEAGMSGQRLVHRVVDHLGEKMVHRLFVGAADIHAGPAPDRLKPLQHLDMLGRIVAVVAARPGAFLGAVLGCGLGTFRTAALRRALRGGRRLGEQVAARGRTGLSVLAVLRAVWMVFLAMRGSIDEKTVRIAAEDDLYLSCHDSPGQGYGLSRAPARDRGIALAPHVGPAAGPGMPALDLESYAQQLIAFVKENRAWAAPIVFALCFAESLAFVSLLLPAWAALVGIGALLAASEISFWPVWLAGAAGAALGDWLSYWIGKLLGTRVYHVWPLSRHPQLIPKAETFVQKWGAVAIFVGRFSGPLRATVPLVAGIFHMPALRFQLANWSSALVWAFVLLAFGDVTAALLRYVWS